MKLNKHIALVVPGFPKDESDSTCLPAVQHFVRGMSKKIERITVFALHYPYSDESYTWNGVTVLPMKGNNSFWKRKFTLYKTLKTAFSHVYGEHPVDGIHSFWLNEATAFGAKLAEEYGLPILATAHGKDVLKENKFLKELKGKDIRFFCLSEFQLSYLKKAGLEDVEVTPWGIEPSIVDEEKEIDLITAGNLIPLKNMDYFVRLCKALHAENANFKALIVGDGPLRKQLENSVEQALMSSAVKFAGMIDHERTIRLIGRSKVLVHASNFEGFGMTMIEALSVGTKVLATPVGVALNNRNVTHLTLNIAKDLALLKELLAQKPSAPVMYSIDTTVDRYLEIYEGF